MICPFSSVTVLSSAVDYTTLLLIVITYTITRFIIIIFAAVVHAQSQCLVLLQSTGK